MTEIKSYKDLIVWQKAMNFVLYVYETTDNFPKSEVFGLTSQMRRAAVSIPSNIAEGSSRGTRKDYANFLRIALGSCTEIETQLEISFRLKYLNNKNMDELAYSVIELIKMLKTMIAKLNTISSN